MKNSIKYARRSESQIRELLSLHAQNTNLTVTEFCRINNVTKGNFYNWRNKFGVALTEPKFIPLQFDDVADSKLFAEIELGHNVRIRLYQTIDAAYFKTLLK